VSLLPSASGWLQRQELTSRGVVIAAVFLLLTSAWVSVGIGGTLGGFFGLCFVLVCLTGALGARDRALFTAGVLPPLAMIAVVLLVSAMAPEAVASGAVDSTAGVAARTIAGVVDLAAALILGHLVALAVVAARVGTRLRAG
jgi:hypothetical protein